MFRQNSPSQLLLVLSADYAPIFMARLRCSFSAFFAAAGAGGSTAWNYFRTQLPFSAGTL